MIIMNNDLWYGYEDEPYRKASSKQSKTKRAKHKHEYAQGLIKDNRTHLSSQWQRVKYCIHCGRIQTINFFSDITEEELKSKPCFIVEDMFSIKNVPLQDKK